MNDLSARNFLDRRELLVALRSLRRGDFSVRLPEDLPGQDGEIARLFVSEGKILKVESSAGNGAPRDRLMRLLDWHVGTFEFSPCAIGGKDELNATVTSLLLEHARVRDEADADKTSKVRR